VIYGRRFSHELIAGAVFAIAHVAAIALRAISATFCHLFSLIVCLPVSSNRREIQVTVQLAPATVKQQIAVSAQPPPIDGRS